MTLPSRFRLEIHYLVMLVLGRFCRVAIPELPGPRVLPNLKPGADEAKIFGAQQRASHNILMPREAWKGQTTWFETNLRNMIRSFYFLSGLTPCQQKWEASLCTALIFPTSRDNLPQHKRNTTVRREG